MLTVSLCGTILFLGISRSLNWFLENLQTFMLRPINSTQLAKQRLPVHFTRNGVTAGNFDIPTEALRFGLERRDSVT